MTVRYVCGALTAALLTCVLSTVAPAHAQTRDATLLPPDQSGWVTAAGCLQRGGKHGDGGTHGDKYVLASPMAPVESVPEETCSATVDARAFELDDPVESGITELMLGRWIEIYGKLEKETSTDPTNLREFDVKSFRMVPVVIPRVSEAVPEPIQLQPPAPRVETPAPPEERPVATTGAIETLPKTASPTTLIGSIGLLSLAGGLAFGLFRHRRSHGLG